MKKHTFQENYEKIFGSIKEGWWEDMSDESQQKYIDKHGSPPGIVQQATKGGGEGPHEPDEPAEDKPEKQQDTASSPAGARTGDESTEELGDLIKQQQNHIEDMAEKGASEEDIQAAEADREDMEQEMEKKEKEGTSVGQQAVDDSRQKAVQSGMALKKAEGEFGKDSPEYEDAKGADDEAQGEYQQAKAAQEQRQKDINSGKVEPETKEEAEGAASDARDSVEKQEKNRAYALQNPDPRDPSSPAEQEEYWNKTVADAEKRAEDAEAKAKEFGPERTGNELNQETLTIDGKQYHRISEVEKEPKPTYEFSEFYKRFKKQE